MGVSGSRHPFELDSRRRRPPAEWHDRPATRVRNNSGGNNNNWPRLVAVSLCVAARQLETHFIVWPAEFFVVPTFWAAFRWRRRRPADARDHRRAGPNERRPFKLPVRAGHVACGPKVGGALRWLQLLLPPAPLLQLLLLF
jgi:hypothetical protein